MTADGTAELTSALAWGSGRRREMAAKIARMFGDAGVLPGQPHRIRLCGERSANGTTYYRLRLRRPDQATGRSRQNSVYLGRLDPQDLAWVRRILVSQEAALTVRVATPASAMERIRALLMAQGRVKAAAKDFGAQLGYRFRGARMLKVRDEAEAL